MRLSLPRGVRESKAYPIVRNWRGLSPVRRCYNKCDWTWTTQNGVNGYIVRGQGDYASNSIFLPAAGDGSETSLRNSGSYGYYWSSVLDSGYSYYAYAFALSFGSSYHFMSYNPRYYGQSVRPVQGFTN